MPRLYWLDETTKNTLNDRIDNLLPSTLTSKHWGTVAAGTSPGGVKRYYITDYRALNLVAGTIRYTLKDAKTRIFFRGQDKDWPLKPALYRNVHNKKEREQAHGWLELVMNNIASSFDITGTPDEREALAQHYGLHTRWLDVVDHIQTSLWFAYDHLRNNEYKPEYDDDVGYIYLIAVPENPNLAKVLDLRTKPTEWLRPHIQQAFAFRTVNPGKELGDLTMHNAITLVIPKQLLKVWSNYDNTPHKYLFPTEAHDLGLQYWNRSLNILKETGIDPTRF